MLRRIALIGFAAAACTGREGGITAIGGNPSNATIRVVNAAAGGPVIDVLSNGTPVTGGSAVAIGASTSCFSVPASAPAVQIRTTGTSNTIPGLSLTLDPLTRYTLLMLGDAGTNRFVLLTDASTTPAAGRTHVRLVNSVTHVGTLDGFITASGAALATPTLTGLAPDAGSAFADVPSGARTVRFTATGTTTPVVDSTDVTLTSRASETLILAQAGGTGPFSLVTATMCP